MVVYLLDLYSKIILLSEHREARRRALSGWMGRRLGRFAIASTTLAFGALVAAEAVATVTGVCPDGSMYIVPRAELIPCRDSKQVRPEDMPPIKPQNLPRPYGWEKFHRQNDPNNPYNLVEDTVREQPEVSAEPQPTAPPTPRAARPLPQRQASVAPPAPAAQPLAIDLALSPEEVRDLTLIVEYSQQRAPAAFARGPSETAPTLAVRFARSGAFDSRLRNVAERTGHRVNGPVVLFTAVAAGDEAFYGNFTFVQGHLAFHPDKSSVSEMGVIDGRLGLLSGDRSVLGYVVLPAAMDLSQPIDIYWNDRQITATLRP